jgi:type I restriction enzyme S subunit
MISGDYTVFECADPLAGRFLEYFYKAMDDRKLLSFLYRGLRKRIPKPGFLSAKTPMPPPDEQEAIVRYLDDVGEKLAKLGGCASDQVGLLQERRAALFSAAVTGKIDVRNWKAPESKTEANVA